MKKIFIIMIILTFPLTVLGDSLQNLANELNKNIIPAQNKVRPALQKKPAKVGYYLKLTGFRLDESQGRHYWVVTLENHSSKTVPRNALEIKAFQYDNQNQSHPAGDFIVNTLSIRPNREIQLQREFVPSQNTVKIGIQVKDRSRNTRLTSGMFETDFRTLKPMGLVKKEVKPVFTGSLKASIHWDNKEKLWFVQVVNIGNGSAKFSEYNFDITPAIRGKKYGKEPFTDVNALYDNVLPSQRAFRIYVATSYDSCAAGDVIGVKITHLESGRVVRTFQPVDIEKYQVTDVAFQPDMSAECGYIHIKLNSQNLPKYYTNGYISGYVLGRTEKVTDGAVSVAGQKVVDTKYKRSTLMIPFNHVKNGSVKIPYRWGCSTFIQLHVFVNWYADFCGRSILLQSGDKLYEKDAIRNW